MDISELKDGHYYKAVYGDVLKVFKAKAHVSNLELGIASNYVMVYEAVIIIENSIDANTRSLLVIDPNYTIEEIDEKTFDKVFKQFSIAKTSILTTLRGKKSV